MVPEARTAIDNPRRHELRQMLDPRAVGVSELRKHALTLGGYPDAYEIAEAPAQEA